MFYRSLLVGFITLSQTCFAVQQLQVTELIKDSSLFSLSLYNALQPSSNLVFSPYSIYSCLSMVYVGAREETAKEMQSLLATDFTQNKLPAIAMQMNQQLAPKTASNSYQLYCANALWVDQDTFILSDFRHVIETDYDGKIQDLNFGDTEKSTSIINEWVSNETEGKIPQLIRKGDIDGSTRALLTSAIYFKAGWAKPFNPKNTRSLPFHATPSSSSPTPMMEQSGDFPYFETELSQILALPFQGKSAQGNRIGVLLILPKEDITLSSVEKGLNVDLLQDWMSKLKNESVNVQIPRFELRTRLDLNPTLEKLGMKTAFTHKADLSGINGMKDLYVSKVVHEAFFALDEAGVTAAAATAAAIGLTSVYENKPKLSFFADHPFLFLIVDLDAKTPIFMGRLQQPQ